MGVCVVVSVAGSSGRLLTRRPSRSRQNLGRQRYRKLLRPVWVVQVRFRFAADLARAKKEGGLSAPVPWCRQPSEDADGGEHRQQKSDRQTELHRKFAIEALAALPAG
jgi:hypothetical protein